MSIEGLYKLQKKLNKLSSNQTYEQALGQAGLIVEAAAIKKVPVDTGILRSSIATSVDINKLEAKVGTNLEYAPYIEYGTGLFASKGGGRNTPWTYQNSKGQWITTQGMRAQPFMGPALNENREKIVKHFAKTINKEINK